MSLITKIYIIVLPFIVRLLLNVLENQWLKRFFVQSKSCSFMFVNKWFRRVL